MATFFGGGGGGANANDIIAQITDSAPETLDTLNELAAALGNDPNFATTVANQLGQKLEASDLEGLATEDYVDDAIAGKSNITNPEFTVIGDQIVSGSGTYNITTFLGATVTIRVSNTTDLATFVTPGMTLQFTDVPSISDYQYEVLSVNPFIHDPNLVSINIVNGGTGWQDLFSWAASEQAGNFAISYYGYPTFAISSQEVGYINGVSGNIQNQLDAKLESSDLTGYVELNEDGFVDPAQLNNIESIAPSPLFVSTTGYSADGITWTDSNLPDHEFTEWKSLTFGNGKFVAVSSSYDGKVAYSTDGVTWTQSTSLDTQAWDSVAYGNGKFVTVQGSTSGAAYSADGITWTASTIPPGFWTSVTYGDGKFVAVNRASGLSSGSVYSTDGITWTTSTMPITGWSSVTHGGGKFVALASDHAGPAAYSTDGITWTTSTLPASATWLSVTYGDGKFVAVSEGDEVAYSTDGITWAGARLQSYFNWSSVTYGNGKFVAVSGASYAYSTDAITWIEVPTMSLPVSVTYGEPLGITATPIASELYVDNQIAILLARIEALESGV